MKIEILAFHLSAKPGAWKGQADVLVDECLVICTCAVFAKGERVWCSPPAAPLLGSDRRHARDDRGRPRWMPLIGFPSDEARDQFSQGVISALRRSHPDALPGAPAAAPCTAAPGAAAAAYAAELAAQ